MAKFVSQMLATEILVKLCSIAVNDALVSGMWTSITSESGLACTRLRHVQQQAKPRKRVGPWSLVTVFAG